MPDRYERRTSVFAGRALAPLVDPDRLMISGSSSAGSEPTGLSISLRDSPRSKAVEVETRLDDPRRGRYPSLLFSLLFNELNRLARPRFPLDLRIERHRQKVLVDGRERSFTVYTCGDWAVASARVRGAAVQIAAGAKVIRELSLRTLGEEELAALIAEWANGQARPSSLTR